MLQALLVDGVVAAAERNDTRPGEGEAVGLGFCLFQQCNVLGRTMIRITGDIARAAVCNLPRDAAEAVPNGVGSTILVGGTLDLVAVAYQTVRFRLEGENEGMEGNMLGTHLAVANPQRKSLGR